MNSINQSINQSEKSFFWQGQSIMLTYKTHIPKEELLKHVCEKSQAKNQPVYWAIGHENGDKKNPYEHTHIAVHYNKRWQFRNCRRFDYDNIHCNISENKKEMSIAKRWARMWKYICVGEKCDPNPLTNWDESMDTTGTFIDTIDTIISADSDIDALKLTCKESKDVLAALAIRRVGKGGVSISQRAKERFSDVELRPWQQSLLNMIENEFKHNDRNVYWIFEKRGCKGKTWFSKYMAINHKSLILKGSGRGADYFHIISKYIDEQGEPVVVIVDLPRTTMDKESIWQIIEGILDGFITSTKYDSVTRIFDSVPVVVFANYAPETKFLSADRWKFFSLETGDLVSISMSDVNNKRIDEESYD